MDYIIPAFTMLSLDSIYLSTLGNYFFKDMIKNIQKTDMKVNMYGAIIVYVLLLFVIYKFIIMERKSPSEAFLLGLSIYGIFDFTNMALFKNYKLIPSIVDTIWGGILFYTTTIITYKLLNITPK